MRPAGEQEEIRFQARLERCAAPRRYGRALLCSAYVDGMGRDRMGWDGMGWGQEGSCALASLNFAPRDTARRALLIMAMRGEAR